MKKISSLILLVAGLCFSSQAQTTVNVTQAGTLSTKGIASNTTSLIVEGTMNAVDFNYIKTSLTSLTTLDLSKVDIVAYLGPLGPKGSTTDYDYAANEIPEMSFYGKSLYISVTLPSSITSIGANAFYNCRKIASISIPASVTKIGDLAFSRCLGMTDFQIQGANLNSIGSSAFFGCAFTTITLPNSVSSIGQAAFSTCPKLKSIVIPTAIALIPSNLFLNCAQLESIVIPNDVTSIGVSAFSGCSALSSLYLGAPSETGVDLSIEAAAFANCTALKNIYINNRQTIPTATETSFSDVPTGLDGCIVTATCGSKSAFESATGWSSFVINAPTDLNRVDTGFKVYANSGSVFVEGSKEGQIIDVYNQQGVRVYSVISSGSQMSFPVANRGVYLVKTLGEIVKVLL